MFIQPGIWNVVIDGMPFSISIAENLRGGFILKKLYVDSYLELRILDAQ